MSFAHAPTVTSLLIGATVTIIDLCMWYQHRLDQRFAVLMDELAELTRLLEHERAAYLETFYLVTKRAVSPSIAPLLQATYRELSHN